MKCDRDRIACWLRAGAGRDLPILAEAFEAMLLDCAERAYLAGYSADACGSNPTSKLPGDFRLVSVNLPGAPTNLGDDAPLTQPKAKREG